MHPISFDHALFYGPNIDAVQDFFETALDFRCAEKAVMPDGLLATWLTCSTKAHDIAFVKHTEPGKFHHVSFNLQDWNEIGRAADLIARYNIALDIGPTRHGITPRRSTSSIRPATATRCSPGAIPTTRITRPALGTSGRWPRESSTTRRR